MKLLLKKTGTGAKILTPNKLLIDVPVLLAQIKAGKNSCKLKMKSDKYYIFCISIIKLPKMVTTIQPYHCNNRTKYGFIKKTQNVLFCF